MSIEHSQTSVAQPPKRQRGHVLPKAPLIALDQPGRLVVANLLALLNCAHTTLYDGIKSGRYPAPDGRVGARPWWKTSTIMALLS